jgi:MFS family permease
LIGEATRGSMRQVEKRRRTRGGKLRSLPSGLTLSTLPLYIEYLGGTTFDYTLTVSLFSVGRMCGGILFGFLSHKTSVKACILMSTAVGIVGNVLYSCAILATDPTPINDSDHVINSSAGAYVALTGRFLVGFGSSTGASLLSLSLLSLSSLSLSVSISLSQCVCGCMLLLESLCFILSILSPHFPIQIAVEFRFPLWVSSSSSQWCWCVCFWHSSHRRVRGRGMSAGVTLRSSLDLAFCQVLQ